jgi:hypothetical protein
VDVRAGGTGFAIGFGRGGSALGPMIAGFLFAAGAGLWIVAMAMAVGSVLAAVLIGMSTAGEGTRDARAVR